MPTPGPLLTARTFVRRTPWLYRIARAIGSRLAPAALPQHLCDGQTDLCLEGSPSSGNSFAVNAIRRALGPLRVSSHTHAVANVKLALRQRVPAVIVVRHPREAIPSRVVRFGASPALAVRDYIDFQRFAVEHRDEVLVLVFEQFVADPTLGLAQVGALLGRQAVVPDVEALKREVLAEMRAYFDAQDTPTEHGLRTAEKERRKETVRSLVEQTAGWSEAVRLYELLATGPPSAAA